LKWLQARLVDDEIAQWQLEGFAWLIKQLPLVNGQPAGVLWTPAAEHFGDLPATGSTQFAEAVFARIKTQCCIDRVDVKLLGLNEIKADHVGEFWTTQPREPGAAGWYIQEASEHGQIEETIAYDTNNLEKPHALISTFAHEIAHLLLHRTRHPPPVDAELDELFTDLTAIFLGYGLFLLDQRFNFSQFQSFSAQGWSVEGLGYLPPADMIFATALFMALHNLETSLARPWMKPDAFRQLQKANKQLKRHDAFIQSLQKQVAAGG
jgi:hypothetical protein